MASAQTDVIGAGGVLATAGGVLVAVGVAETAGSHHSVFSNSWFDVGLALLIIGLVLVVGALTVSWRSRQRDELDDFEGFAEPTIRETVEYGIQLPRGLGRGLGALVPEMPDPPPPSPLDLRVVDESWRLCYNTAWVFGLAIRITNLTDKPVILTQYYLEADIGTKLRPPVDGEVLHNLLNSFQHLKDAHQSDTFDGEITVPPLSSVTRWRVDISLIPLPDGGRPRCTFGTKDTLDNEYKLDILARAPETYHS